MSELSKILEQVHFTETIDGVEFVLRKVSAEMSLTILGIKTLGIVRGAQSEKDIDDDTASGIMSEVMPKYLKAAMVSPKLGDVTNVEADTITVEDLGPFASKIFMVLFERSGYANLGNFPASSEDTKGEN